MGPDEEIAEGRVHTAGGGVRAGVLLAAWALAAMTAAADTPLDAPLTDDAEGLAAAGGQGVGHEAVVAQVGEGEGGPLRRGGGAVGAGEGVANGLGVV